MNPWKCTLKFGALKVGDKHKPLAGVCTDAVFLNMGQKETQQVHQKESGECEGHVKLKG